MTFLIPLTRGYCAIVDEADIDLSAHKWTAVVKPTGAIFAVRWVTIEDERAAIPMHRLILERKLGRSLFLLELTDHEDGDGLNNRRANLRIASHAQTGQNARLPRHNTSGVRGVHWNKRAGKWHVQIRIDGKVGYLGLFDDLAEAKAARIAGEIKYYGEFSPHLSRHED